MKQMCRMCIRRPLSLSNNFHVKDKFSKNRSSFHSDAHNSIIQLASILRESVNIKRKLLTRDYNSVKIYTMHINQFIQQQKQQHWQ